MYAPAVAHIAISKRATAILAALAIAVSALFATATSAHQTLVHTHLAQGGTIVVTGYDGGAPLAPKSTP
jgi:methionine-rich copper-binding protein CopC